MVRVLIERWVKKESDHGFHLAMRDMRRQAVPCQGYISGETLRDVADPHHYVILSTWQSVEEWNVWAESQARQEVRARIEPLLSRAEKVTVFEPA